MHICAMLQRWYVWFMVRRQWESISQSRYSIYFELAQMISKKLLETHGKGSSAVCVCVCHNSNVSGIFSDILEQKQFEEGSFPHSKKAILTLAALAYFRCEGVHYFKLHLLHETCKASLALLTTQ